MLLKKDIEIIMSTPELWQALHDLQALYNRRFNGEADCKKYKYYCKLFREQVEDEKGEILPF